MTEPSPSQGMPSDARPLVGRRVSNRGVILFGVALALGSGTLFAALEGRRTKIAEPSLASVNSDDAALVSSGSDIVILPAYGDDRTMMGSSAVDAEAPPRFAALAPRPLARSAGTTPPAPVSFAPLLPSQPRYAAPASPSGLSGVPSGSPLQALPARSGPETVYQATRNAQAAPRSEPAAAKPDERVKASRFDNPGSTVPKGTVIQAVLETALDSTRAGFARAVISRDVFSFDGTRVVIPRGSRLIGEYKADLQTGQTRALIQWQRLMRPDGVMITLDSPSADPLGRAGLKGEVNTHFAERFGAAILQSAISIGTQVAVNKLANGTVVYAVPILSQALPVTQPDKIQPTLKVRQGTSVSVFVARDLDFAGFEK